MVEVMFLISTSSQTVGMEGPLALYCQCVSELDHLEVHIIIVFVYACVYVCGWGDPVGGRSSFTSSPSIQEVDS